MRASQFSTAVILMALLAGCATSRPSSFTLVLPQNGAAVTGGAALVAELSDDFPREEVRSVQFEYSRDGTNYSPITGAAPSGMAEYVTVWNTNALPSGEYLLRARMTSAAMSLVTPPSRVRLNQRPIVVASAKLSADQAVTLDATPSFDPDGRVVKFEWDVAGRGVSAGATVTISGLKPGSLPVSITVTDDLGATSTGHYILTSAQDKTPQLREKTTCGCAKMDVVDKGGVSGPDGFTLRPEARTRIPPAEQGTLGLYHDGPIKGSADGQFRFEVVATLKDNSKPQLCAEGQRAKGSVTVRKGKANEFTQHSGTRPNQFLSSDPRYDSSLDDPKARKVGECKYSGDNWCDDGYHGGGDKDGKGSDNAQPPDTLKVYEGQKRILWLDAAGTRVKKDTQLPAQFNGKYEAVVSGQDGECKCTWEVTVDIGADSTVTGELKNKKCTP